MTRKRQAEQHLRRDPKLREIIEVTKLRRRTPNRDVYTSLLRTIIYQQLSGRAAASIHSRFLELFDDGYPAPARLAELDELTLRSAGVSRQKGRYLKNVAGYWREQGLDGVEWKQMDDDQIIAELTQIKGVGVWSVQMLLMFTLKRPDVFPIGDLGIRNAIVKKYRLRSQGKTLDQRMMKIAQAWRPHRTLASLYLWSWLDGQG